MAPLTAAAASSWNLRLEARRWLAPGTFEIAFARPPGFRFAAGQRLRLQAAGHSRDYSLLGPAASGPLTLCIRQVAGGPVSAWLAGVPLGQVLEAEGPLGYFVWRPSSRPAVFLATGTGVAPFVALVRDGVRGFTLAHGVRTAAELYYAAELRAAAGRYIPCLSAEAAPPQEAFRGRVTDWLGAALTPGDYDFYLCGRGEMIREALARIDAGFHGSRVFSETFF